MVAGPQIDPSNCKIDKLDNNKFCLCLYNYQYMYFVKKRTKFESLGLIKWNMPSTILYVFLHVSKESHEPLVCLVSRKINKEM